MNPTLRGALAGAGAAALWAAQQPLDKCVFGVDYDDCELLGRYLGGRAAGVAAHLANGAAFGAIYAHIAPALPIVPRLRGPAAGLVEHIATWPAIELVEPGMRGSLAAFAQSTWRHLLFGFLLGEIERKLAPPEAVTVVVDDALVSRNGHGSVEHVAAPL